MEEDISFRHTESLDRNLNLMESKDITNPLLELSRECKYLSENYWRVFGKLSMKDNLLVLPLIISGTLSSIGSFSQLVQAINPNEFEYAINLSIQVITTIAAIVTTILTATQKYLSYDNRAEVSRQVAKKWDGIRAKIEYYILYFQSTPKVDKTLLFIILQEIFNEMDDTSDLLLDNAEGDETSDTISNAKGAVRSLLRESQSSIV